VETPTQPYTQEQLPVDPTGRGFDDDDDSDIDIPDFLK
jgi:hypothetical protein